MTSDLSAYGLPVAAMAMIALIIWAPTVFIFIKRHQGDKHLTPAHLFTVLAGELGTLVVIAAIADFVGLNNIGGYLLAIALVIGAFGPHALSFKFRRKS